MRSAYCFMLATALCASVAHAETTPSQEKLPRSVSGGSAMVDRAAPLPHSEEMVEDIKARFAQAIQEEQKKQAQNMPQRSVSGGSAMVDRMPASK